MPIGLLRKGNNAAQTLVVRPSGDTSLTPFDPIKTNSFTRGALTVRGQVRNSIISRSSARPAGGRRTVEFRAGALPTRPDSVRVPALPRRNYIPTLSRLELE